MSDLIPFSFESHSVRAFTIDGNPWFVGKDVCDVLGYGQFRYCLVCGRGGYL